MTNAACYAIRWPAPVWNPQGWSVEQACSVHKGMDIQTHMATLEAENKTMSFARAKMADIAAVPVDDIEFEFDSKRAVLLKPKASAAAAILAKSAEILTELGKIDRRIKII